MKVNFVLAIHPCLRMRFNLSLKKAIDFFLFESVLIAVAHPKYSHHYNKMVQNERKKKVKIRGSGNIP